MAEIVDQYWWGIVMILFVGWTVLLRPTTPGWRRRRSGAKDGPGADQAPPRGR
jgi:hypothetical protein